MSTLDELRDYCETPEPLGALLLTGEWGCGKTYLIEKDLQEVLGNNFIIIRLSLFGIESIESIDNTIKKMWFEYYCLSLNGAKKLITPIKTLKKLSNNLPVKNEIKSILNFDIIPFITIRNKINDRQIILVFDDLERCTINAAQILGCINNYCENLKFHTIIVANENKLLSKAKKHKISIEAYMEMKEKIVQRAIKYSPNFNQLIGNIINNMNFSNDKYEYKNFLIELKPNLIELITEENNGSDNKIIAGNIRCIKYALKEFFRIYVILKHYGLKEIDKYLYSFIIFYIICKTRRIETIQDWEKLGFKIKKSIPYWFNTKFLFLSVEQWVIEGIWDSELLQEEVKKAKRLQQTKIPSDILRGNNILNMDEQIIEQGFPKVLELAYNGELSLNEYINLIYNSQTARLYKYSFPICIDWEQIKIGIERHIQKMIFDYHKDEPSVFFCLNIKLSHEEREAYELITKFKEKKLLFYGRNEDYYKKNLQNDPHMLWKIFKNIDCSKFDIEMADITANVFSQMSNSGRNMFQEEFVRWLKRCSKLQEFQKETSSDGLSKLINLLESEITRLQNSEKKLCLVVTKKFLDDLKELSLKWCQEKPISTNFL